MAVLGLACSTLGCAAAPGVEGEVDFGPDLPDLRPVDMADAAMPRCPGEKYDVNATPSDGCEVLDDPLANHTEATAVDLGSRTCDDVDSALNIMGMLPADLTVHAPAISGFDAASGSAPDWLKINATGGACVNDLYLRLEVTSTTKPSCYRLTAKTSTGTYTCQSSATGTCEIMKGTGAYDDASAILLSVAKTCAGNARGNYKITGHL